MKTAFGHIRIPLKRIHLELTNVCNFNCVFCPKSVMTRPYGYMDQELAKRAISEIAENRLSEKITFHLMGEPTLHPHFFEILEHALHKGVNVGLTTNGSTLRGPVGAKLLEYGLHQVDVSLQTPDEESFALRKAGSLRFQSYFDSMMEFFGKYHRAHPDSVFKFRIMNTAMGGKSLEEKLGPIRVISSGKELRNVVRHYANLIHEHANAPATFRHAAEAAIRTIAPYKWNVIEVVPNVFLETYLLDGWGHAFEGEVREAGVGYCFGMRDHFAVLYNGDVVLCCMDYDGKTAFGNIEGHTLREVLSYDRLGEIMHGFRRYRFIHPYCRRCQGSRSFVSWLLKPVAAVIGLKVIKPFFYKHTKLFE
ncbi:MAG: radical SAM protein [Desulfobacteraceae bacterium]|nr:radical SAM protein [Desulfobacteraceae bacterium]